MRTVYVLCWRVLGSLSDFGSGTYMSECDAGVRRVLSLSNEWAEVCVRGVCVLRVRGTRYDLCSWGVIWESQGDKGGDCMSGCE